MVKILEQKAPKSADTAKEIPQKEPSQQTPKNPLLALAEKEASFAGSSYSQQAIEKIAPQKAEYNSKKEHWSKVAKINLLGELAATIGGGISAAWGGQPGLPNPVAARLATKRMNQLDVDYQRELERFRRDTLSEALRQDKRSDDKTKDYLDRLQWQQKTELETERRKEDENFIKERDAERYKQSAKSAVAKQEASEFTNGQRNVSYPKSTARGSSGARAAKGGVRAPYSDRDRKVVTYIKDANRKPVPIYPDDWTELYRLADSFDMLGDYRNSQNDYERKQQLSAAIQRAYVEREKLQQKTKK